jgi:hypothetical protein
VERLVPKTLSDRFGGVTLAKRVKRVGDNALHLIHSLTLAATKAPFQPEKQIADST